MLIDIIVALYRQNFIDEQSWLFTGVLPNGYNPPGSFCFDILCDDQPIMVSRIFLTNIIHFSHACCYLLITHTHVLFTYR